MISASGSAMGNVALTFSALGLHQDALAMQEKVLEFRRRVLPENHPQIGATRFCGILIQVDFDALCFRRSNVQYRPHVF